MIKISDVSSVEIPELENILEGTFDAIWLEFGIEGTLPRVQIDLNSFYGNIEFEKFQLKLFYNGNKLADCNCCVNQYYYNQSRFTLEGYLVEDIEFIKGRSISTYKSINEIVNSLWKGKLDISIPSQENLYLCQMNMANHKYLTRAIRCSAAYRTFYYDTFNTIKSIELSSRQIDLDLTKKDNNHIIVKVKGNIGKLRNKYEFTDDQTGIIANKYVSTDGINYYYADNKHIQLEENGMRNNLILQRTNNQFQIEYSDSYNINIGDVLKLSLTSESTIICMPIARKLRIDKHKLIVTDRCIEYAV